MMVGDVVINSSMTPNPSSDLETPQDDPSQPPSVATFEQDLHQAEYVSQISYLDQIYNSKNALSKRHRKKLKMLRIQKTKQCCQVCQLAYQKDDHVVQLPCKHMIHKDCSKPWFKVSRLCPICRLDIEAHFKMEEEQFI